MSASLATLQQGFLGALLDGTPMDAEIEPADGLAFYRGSVEANWRAALASAYPVAERLVGPAFFGEAARQYGRSHPSTSGDLHRFGESFGAFLRSYPPAASLAYLPDVAGLEWAIHECAHAEDAKAFDFQALAAIPDSEHGRLVARMSPGTRCLGSAHPIVAIHEANRPDRDGVPDRLEGPDHVLVRRQGSDVLVERIDDRAWDFLHALAAGEDLEHASAALEAQASRMPELLAGWIAAGVIEALEPGARRE